MISPLIARVAANSSGFAMPEESPPYKGIEKISLKIRRHAFFWIVICRIAFISRAFHPWLDRLGSMSLRYS